MKRLPALLLLLCAAFSAQAQRLRFAVVTDTHIGREHGGRKPESRDPVDRRRRLGALRSAAGRHLARRHPEGAPQGPAPARPAPQTPLPDHGQPRRQTSGTLQQFSPHIRHRPFLLRLRRGALHRHHDRPVRAEPPCHAAGEEVRWLAERCAVPQPTVVAAHHTPELVAGGSAVFDGCDTSQIVLWLAGHLHVNKIQETSPVPPWSISRRWTAAVTTFSTSTEGGCASRPSIRGPAAGPHGTPPN